MAHNIFVSKWDTNTLSNIFFLLFDINACSYTDTPRGIPCQCSQCDTAVLGKQFYWTYGYSHSLHWLCKSFLGKHRKPVLTLFIIHLGYETPKCTSWEGGKYRLWANIRPYLGVGPPHRDTPHRAATQWASVPSTLAQVRRVWKTHSTCLQFSIFYSCQSLDSTDPSVFYDSVISAEVIENVWNVLYNLNVYRNIIIQNESKINR